jgi:hypothetical protein
MAPDSPHYSRKYCYVRQRRLIPFIFLHGKNHSRWEIPEFLIGCSLCSVPVLPDSLDDGEVSLGVLADTDGLQEGELMLKSRGGASIVLKNNGKVLINGREF